MIRTTPVAGGTMSYLDTGVAENGTVVCLHSLGTNREMWAPVVDILVAAGYRVLCPDARGHGASESSAPPGDPLDWVADLEALWADAGVETAHLAGVSMGAAQAVDFALNHPDWVLSIVVGGAFGTLDAESANAKVAALVGGAESNGMVEWADRYVDGTLFTDETRARETIRAAIAGVTLEMYAASARTVFRPRAGELSSLGVPVLIVWGTEDVKTPRAMSDGLLAELPKAALIEIEGAGHLPNVDAPTLFADHLLAHIRSAGA